MVFLGGKNEVSADFSVNFQKSAYIAYDCSRGAFGVLNCGDGKITPLTFLLELDRIINFNIKERSVRLGSQ